MEAKGTCGIKVSLFSLFLSILIFLIKLIAYFITKSVAIYSDAMESTINILSAFTAFIGLKIALKPPDPEHPYGHTKIEYLFSILEATFILLASISILWKAFQNLKAPQPPPNLNQGFILIGLTIVFNGLISLLAYLQGKKENSPILVAHAHHIFTDVLTTSGVIVGLFLAKIFQKWILDPLIAIVLGINILYMGFKLTKESVSSLLDASLPKDKAESIKNIITNTIESHPQRDQIHDIHEFKTRRAGRKSFVEFHLTVSDTMSVKCAHDICNEIEKNISEKHEDVKVTIHIEPKEYNQG
ncbi:cation transporter [Thermodesulfobacterium sp. TA1]|uniref:cation diffusion facilitator family transporter n=1 Tax=Thermodesulfobacterium sp. TA1 TaxID=2234087 RepID=UPI001232AC51|nr:cation diffusion facilitator family transporter [Thermodesulfobacterium sp. TA1]QER41862.1 cation transporter [Thermodesulfobacterium sp. TA1]